MCVRVDTSPPVSSLALLPTTSLYPPCKLSQLLLGATSVSPVDQPTLWCDLVNECLQFVVVGENSIYCVQEYLAVWLPASLSILVQLKPECCQVSPFVMSV